MEAQPKLLYEYGTLLAWFWRILMLVCIVLAGGFLLAGGLDLQPLALFGAASLLGPIAFFGTVVVARATLVDGNVIEIQTLLLTRRRIPRALLGRPRVRMRYESENARFAAPRAWIPVQGSLPIYVDLQGRIPDKRALALALGLPMRLR